MELEDQAWKAFTRYLKNDFKTLIYKKNRGDWRKAEIVVSTVQSLMVNNKYMVFSRPLISIWLYPMKPTVDQR